MATVNIWADVIAALMIAFSVVFCIFQITGNFVSGRLQDRFRGKQWPKLEEIIPSALKLLHGSLVICITLLFISGLYLRFPFYDNGYVDMHEVHYLLIAPLVLTFVLRVYYALTKDTKDYSVNRKEWIDAFKVMLYHAFILSRYPHYSKYNVFQKIMYSVLFPVMTIILIMSGFCLLWPQALLAWISPLFNGLSMTIALASVIHWSTAAAIIALSIVHICLTSIEDFPTMMIFIGLSEQPAIGTQNQKNEGSNELAPTFRKI